jgi:methionyl-tRNA synthetase
MLDHITFDQFAPLDIHVAMHKAAEAVPKVDCLLKLTLDRGFDTMTVLSGITEHFSPEEVVGKDVCVLTNWPRSSMDRIEVS